MRSGKQTNISNRDALYRSLSSKQTRDDVDGKQRVSSLALVHTDPNDVGCGAVKTTSLATAASALVVVVVAYEL